MMSPTITIDGRKIGQSHPPYVIAEMSGNHNGEIKRAFRLMEAAKASGADAVKLQTYTADTLTIDHDGKDFQIKDGLWAGRTLYELYEDAHTPWEWHEALFAKGRELGITVFSSPFDDTAVNFLESLETPAYKIASFEIVDLSLVVSAARTAKPLILSTGMANEEEISEAVAGARDTGNDALALLHCVSGYPTPACEINLRTLPYLAETFTTVVGLSDHTLGTAISIAAVTMGAAIIEKHFTLLRADGGPDAAFSIEPQELAGLVKDCRAAWEALGRVNFDRTTSEAESAIFRRSLYAVQDIPAGTPLTKENVRSIRPGYGLPPKYLSKIIGRSAAVSIRRGTALHLDMLND